MSWKQNYWVDHTQLAIAELFDVIGIAALAPIDLVFCYKIVFGLVSVNLDDFFRDSICFGDKRSSIQAI